MLFKTQQILGVAIPYRPQLPQYKLLGGVWTAVEDDPPHISHLKAGRIGQFLQSACTEICLHLSAEHAVKLRGTRTRLLVSASIPPGSCYYDEDGFYRNEAEAESEAQDSDGDTGVFTHPEFLYSHSIWRPDPDDFMHKWHGVERPEGRYLIWVKMPKTFRSIPLLVLDTLPDENLLELRPWEAVKATDEVEQGMKALKDNDTGLKTWTWNMLDLDSCQEGSTFLSRALTCHKLSGRFQDIETDGLKGRSKDDKFHQEQKHVTAVKVAPEYSWYFSSAKITKTSNLWTCFSKVESEWGSYLVWAPQDLYSIARRAQALQPVMVPLQEIEEESVNFVADGDKSLVSRLIQLGLLTAVPLGEFREGLPPAMMIWLSRPKTLFCSMVSVKRGAWGETNELGFCFLVPPVAMEINGELRIVSPLKAMAQRLKELNVSITNPETGEDCGNFPRSINDLERCPGKAKGLQKAISDFLSEYGDMVPTVQVEGLCAPTTIAKATCQRTIAIDFGTSTKTAEERMKFLLRVNEMTRVCVAAGKGSNPRVRKYALARENGTPEWSNSRAHPRRAGNQRAQLLRAEHTEELTLAIVCMETSSQTFLTPSGVEKQKSKGVFMPSVSKEITEEHKVPHRFVDWAGVENLVWVGSTRETHEIGKLLDPNGFKSVPIRTTQAATDSFNIDLIVPLTELEGKGLQETWLSKSTIQKISWQGQEVDAYIISRKLLRSGAPSENVKPSSKPMRVTGLDGICIQTELMQIYPNLKTKPNFGLPLPNYEESYALSMQECIGELIRTSKITI